ncbi:hypothetical protein Hdeb2414_s0004g00133871 [Helianthus debilis subsp. tardiflorus]
MDFKETCFSNQTEFMALKIGFVTLIYIKGQQGNDKNGPDVILEVAKVGKILVG